MKKNKISLRKKFSNILKKFISKIVLFFLYRGFKVLYKKDSRVEEELDNLEEGFVLNLELSKNGPKMILKKENNEIIRLKENAKPDILISFKSIDVAFLVLTGRLGISRAYAEHRFTLQGDIAIAMGIVRCMELVEAYLFPKFITKNILKEVPKREISMLSAYKLIIF